MLHAIHYVDVLLSSLLFLSDLHIYSPRMVSSYRHQLARTAPSTVLNQQADLHIPSALATMDVGLLKTVSLIFQLKLWFEEYVRFGRH